MTGRPPDDARAGKAGLPALFAFDARALNLAEGLRSGLAIGSIVALAEWLHLPTVVTIGIAAWLACLADPGGTLRDRLGALLRFGLAGAALTACFGLLVAQAPTWLTILLASAVLFGFGMLRPLGPAMQQRTMLLALVLVLALLHPRASLHAAALGALTFALGSAWALLLTALLWLAHPFQSARGAVAEGWRALDGLAADLQALLALPRRTPADWLGHARRHRRRVRATLDDARHALILAAEPRTDPAWPQLAAAEMMFDALVGLAGLIEERDEPGAVHLGTRVLQALRPALRREAAASAHGTRSDQAASVAALQHLATLPDAAPLGVAVARVGAALADACAPALPPQEQEVVPQPDALAALRAGFAWTSPVLRHALRMAVAASVAFAVMLGLQWERSYWAAIALIVTLQPEVALTLTRAAERIGGTMLGALAGAAVALLLPSPAAMAVALFLLAVATAALRRVSYGLYVAGAAAVIVVLLEVDHPGSAEAVQVALLRAGYTLAGGAFALACAALLWPDWARARLEPALRAAMVTTLRKADMAMAELAGDATEAALRQLRAAAGRAAAEAEAVIQRSLLEHGRIETPATLAALRVDGALRRASGRLATLRLSSARPSPELARAWRGWFTGFASLVAESRDGLPQRPDVQAPAAAAQAMDAIAREFEMAADGLGVLRAAGADE